MSNLHSQFEPMQASPAPNRRHSFSDGQAPPLQQQQQQQQAAASSSSSSSAPPPSVEQVYNHLQQQITFLGSQLALQQAASSSSSSPPVAPSAPSLSSTEAMTEAIARALAANAPINLPLFDGSGNTSGIAAHSWLRQAERAFEERESIAGYLGDARRVSAASTVLRGAADTWYASLSQRPLTWAAFKLALTSRFQPASARLLIEGKLQALVDNTAKIRERLNTQGLERYTALYQQLAGQIPSEMMLERTKVLQYSHGLPARMRELVMQAEETAHETGRPLELNAVADKILKRAAARETAASGPSSSPPARAHTDGDAMDLSAIEMCRQAFDLSATEAKSYLEETEGWAEHDTTSTRSHHSGSTSHSSQPAAKGPGNSHTSPAAADLTRQVNALQAQLAAMSRRTISPPVKRDVPEQLAMERRTAGLCIRCGVAKYEAGGRGHNSRTCQAPVDTSTSAAAGAKRAGLPVFQ